MDVERWAQVEALFDAAITEPAGARAAVLAACADEAVRREAEAMVAAADASAQFLEEPAGVTASALVSDVAGGDGPRVGPYRLVREVGRGGMGVVYLAERDDGQFSRRVAVKLLRRDVSTAAFHARFLAERQILATFDHPNIARLLDGGVTADGRPFYVMELVEGRPIDRHCDEERLTVEERLRLFSVVGRAVQHAHQNLVVHGDLKPSNVLVTADGTIKVIDFGIARLLSTGTAPSSWRTELHLMTPEYASPEQVRAGPITTASDVYQLGLVLDRLLAGHRPYHVRSQSPAEVDRVVGETVPQSPSTVAAEAEGERPEGEGRRPTPDVGSRARRTRPERLRDTLRGDLDRIVLKALRQEPERRYASAGGLVEDVERYLRGWPVAAHPDTAAYRARKFVGRHRSAVAAGVAFAVLLVGYATTVTVLQAQTARARDRAERLNALFLDLLAPVSPGLPSARPLAGERPRAPGVAARPSERQSQFVSDLMGLYEGRGMWGEVARVAVLNLEIAESVAPPQSPEVVRALCQAGTALARAGDAAGSRARLRECLALSRRVWGDQAPETVAALTSLTVATDPRAFADRVDSFLPGTPRPPEGSRTAQPEQGLGPPDFAGVVSGRERWVSLGDGGEITLEFTDNALVDGPGPDLAVFEIGPNRNPIEVAVSEGGRTFVEVGTVPGGTSYVDIGAVAVPGARYRYVRLRDGTLPGSTSGDAGPYPGADLDAVVVIDRRAGH